MQIVLAIAVISLLLLACLGSWLGAVFQFSGIPGLPGLGRSDVSFITALPLALLVGVSLSVAIIGGRTMISATAQKGPQARVFVTQALCTDAAIPISRGMRGLDQANRAIPISKFQPKCRLGNAAYTLTRPGGCSTR